MNSVDEVHGTLCWNCSPEVFYLCPWVVDGVFTPGVKCHVRIATQFTYLRVYQCPNYKPIVSTLAQRAPKNKKPGVGRPITFREAKTGRFVGTYKSMHEAAKKLNVSMYDMMCCLNGKHPTCGIYICKTNEYNE